MRPVSTDFLAALRGSHSIDAHVDLYFPEAPSTAVSVPIESGAVSIDRTAQIRRTGSIVIPWTLEANLGVDLRTLPLGGYANVQRGIRWPDDTAELAQLGVFRVEAVTWSTSEQRATLELADRMAQVRDETFAAPFTATGLRVAEAALQIVEEVFGSEIGYLIRYDPAVTLVDVNYTGSRVDALFELARAVGAVAYFDADGDFVFEIAAGRQAVVQTGTLADNSPTITGLTDTTELAVGMTVTGAGVPPYRTIAAINSLTQITLNAFANILGAKTTAREAGSKVMQITRDETDDLSPGMVVAGPGIVAGTKIVAIQPGQITTDLAATQTRTDVLSYTAAATQPLTFAGPATAYPAWEIDAGEDGVLVGTNESLDRSSVHNGILVTGQATAKLPAFSVLVVDDEPTSPTRWGGPFGRIPRLEATNAVQTAAQATIMGETLLNESLGLARTLAIESAPNPALEAGDVVRVVFDDGRDELHLIDIVRIGLGVETIVVESHTTERPTTSTTSRWTPFPTRRSYHDADAWRELRRVVPFERVRFREPVPRRRKFPHRHAEPERTR